MVHDFDISGPVVDDDIRRLIGRYGAENVKGAIKRQTAGKRGPIPKVDWSGLRNVLREDASRWLAGEDPFCARSNRSIARRFAEDHPGQSPEATYRRIMGKLSKGRRYYTLVEAEWLSQREYAYTENFRAIRGLIAFGVRRRMWEEFLSLREASLSDYKTKFGEPPASITMQDLQTESAKTISPTPRTSPGNVMQILLRT